MTRIITAALAAFVLFAVPWTAQAHHHLTTTRQHFVFPIDFDEFDTCGSLTGVKDVEFDLVYIPDEQHEDACNIPNDPNFDDGSGAEECDEEGTGFGGLSQQDANNIFIENPKVDGVAGTTFGTPQLVWTKQTSGADQAKVYAVTNIRPDQCSGHVIGLRPWCAQIEGTGDPDLSQVWFSDPNNDPAWEWPLGWCNKSGEGDPNGNPMMFFNVLDPNLARLHPSTGVWIGCHESSWCDEGGANYGTTTTCTDDDSDGVCDYDDNCSAIANAPVYPLGFQTVTGCGRACETDPNFPDYGQLDDDADGYGNRCDADFNNVDNLVNPTDLALFQAANGKKRAKTSACSSDVCDIYDLNGVDNLINPGDLNIFNDLNGKKKNKGLWRRCSPDDEAAQASFLCDPSHPDFVCGGDPNGPCP